MKNIIIIAAISLLLCGCTTNTDIFIYDDAGVEQKIARVRQETNGLAVYDMKKEGIIIKVDTRHKNWIERNLMPLFQYAARQATW